MLVLSRKLGESIVVEGPCRIVLVDIDRGRCRLGIEADRSLSIMREELLSEEPQPKSEVKPR